MLIVKYVSVLIHMYVCLFVIAQLNENEFKSRLVTEEAKLKALLQPESRNVDDVTSRVNREGEGGGGEGGEKEGAEKAGEVAKQAAVVKYLKVSFNFSLIQTPMKLSILVRCPYFRG